MRTIISVVFLAACSDAAPSSLLQVDAVPSVARLHADASSDPPPELNSADASVWLDADEFSISLEETKCLGSCPSFWVRIDQSGHVAYRGEDYTARPGYYEVDVSDTAANALRSSIIKAGFLGLRDEYTTKGEGCARVSTDSPTFTFVLQTPKRTKRVKWYLGCDADARSALNSIEKQIVATTAVGRFLSPSPDRSGCESSEPLRDYVDTFVITNGPGLNKIDQGLLHFGKNRTWSVTTCEGEPMANGEYAYHVNWDRILLPSKMDPSPLAWPGVDEARGVALVQRSGLSSWITLTTLGLTDEQQQWAYEGDTCGAPAP